MLHSTAIHSKLSSVQRNAWMWWKTVLCEFQLPPAVYIRAVALVAYSRGRVESVYAIQCEPILDWNLSADGEA